MTMNEKIICKSLFTKVTNDEIISAFPYNYSGPCLIHPINICNLFFLVNGTEDNCRKIMLLLIYLGDFSSFEHASLMYRLMDSKSPKLCLDSFIFDYYFLEI